jgi:hypothetical protein
MMMGLKRYEIDDVVGRGLSTLKDNEYYLALEVDALLQQLRELLEEAIELIPSDESTDNWHRAVDAALSGSKKV